MDIYFDTFPQHFMLIFARIAGLFTSVTFFGKTSVPIRFRLGAALLITLVLAPTVSQPLSEKLPVTESLPGLFMNMLGEMMLGFVLGIICDLAIGICLFAGTIAGLGSGLMMAQDIDPMTGVSNTLLSQLMQATFVILVILNDGHLILLKMMAVSFTALPPKLGWLDGDLLVHLASLGSVLFSWGVRLAAPMMATALLVSVGFGLVARLAPDFNILFLSLPVRLIAVLVAYGFTFRYSGYFFDKVLDFMLTECAKILA